MFRRSYRSLLMLLLLLAGSGGVFLYHEHNSPEMRLALEAEAREAQLRDQLNAKTEEAERNRVTAEKFKQFVGRLKATNWVAEVYVKNPSRSAGVEGGIAGEYLVFSEYDDAGKVICNKTVWIEGKRAMISAQVIRFAPEFVAEGDPLRGRSVVLFRCIHGFKDSQSLESAFANPINQIHQENILPPALAKSDPNIVEFQRKLWSQFWALDRDPELASSLGVRAAHGNSVFTDFEPGFKYKVSMEANGGLVLTPEQLPPAVADAFEHEAGGHDAPATVPATNPSNPLARPY